MKYSTAIIIILSLLLITHSFAKDEDIHYKRASHDEKSTLHKIKDTLMGESPKERAKEALENRAEFLRQKASELEGNARKGMEMRAEEVQAKADTFDASLKEKGNE